MSKPNITCPSGFPEFSPEQELVRQHWIKTITQTYERHGFTPVTTPLVEREENLVAKGGNPKEMYVLKRLLDDENDTSHSGMALRFDHTVPLALYVARHFSNLAFPFRRYSIGPNFRGERAQKGRYRQFDQCDIDVIGVESLSLINDALMPAIIIQIFETLGIGDFVVRINNRKILIGFFESIGIPSDKIKETLDIVDDLEKIGEKEVLSRLKSGGLTDEKAQQILDFTEISGSPTKIITQLKKMKGTETFTSGVEDLRIVVKSLIEAEIPQNRYTLDLSIARGLDYYTGTVYETNLTEHKGLGSICSGGRYDDLAKVFTGKKMPGVGISIGLSRLLPQLFEAGIITTKRKTPTQALIIAMSENELPTALKIGTQLREAGINTENYCEAKKIGKQFDYANRQGIPHCIVIGEDEVKKGVVVVKDMESGDQREVKMEEVANPFLQ